MSEAPRLWLLLLNVSHGAATEGARERLISTGVEVRDVRTTDPVAMPERVDAWLAERGRRALLLRDAAPLMRRGDVLLTGWERGRKLSPALRGLKRRGVRVAGFVEGCRFGLPGRYDIVSPLLAWGPSARELCTPPVRIVGAPVVEAAARRRWTGGSGAAVINYKFPFDQTDAGGAWLARAREACAAAGLEAALSAHPQNRPERMEGLTLATAPIGDLLTTAEVLISRPSTVIYEALAMGAPVVLFPAPGEPMAEFADPMGAFPVVTPEEVAAGPEALAAALAARPRRVRARPGPRRIVRPFLNRHVSRRPRPAEARMAAALLSLLGRAPVRAGRDGHAASGTRGRDAAAP